LHSLLRFRRPIAASSSDRSRRRLSAVADQWHLGGGIMEENDRRFPAGQANEGHWSDIPHEFDARDRTVRRM
jgi:hypothetical protein